ncbi:antibiotic biosynthesis monooxygenase [Staphylococcus sp. HMSC070D05]|uniref:antibiotic biosynthesis monooxygenase family protein n=1 Tax=Staphylococcus sp. HMSC070D05 TaxID=1739538 RepID=UPI0008A3D555|nr:antibiotic biosynthesis monooxygenase [Staphylococcus sp. HMSC070D05]OFO42288.1 antibiotic biosynthesis monooxygenase [Staphylococcus sp. HMSC070D05]
MTLIDSYKTYVIEEKENQTMSIEKNNDVHLYTVLESINELTNDSFCVLNHLFVNESNESQFESKFLKRTKYLQDVPGFKALRFLRPPTKHRHYIILTLWKDRQSFYDWQNSDAYDKTHKKRGTKQGVDNKIVNRDLSYNVRIELANLETSIDIDNMFNIQRLSF